MATRIKVVHVPAYKRKSTVKGYTKTVKVKVK